MPGINPANPKSLKAILDIFNFLYTPCGRPVILHLFITLFLAEFLGICASFWSLCESFCVASSYVMIQKICYNDDMDSLYVPDYE